MFPVLFEGNYCSVREELYNCLLLGKIDRNTIMLVHEGVDDYL